MKKILTGRQMAFVEGYLLTGNAYQSALKAGYAPATARKGAGRLLKMPQVADYVRRRQRELAEKLIDTKAVVAELESIAFADVGDYAAVKDGRLVVGDTAGLKKEKRAAIAGLREGTKGVELKLYDKEKALELLGRAGGLFGLGRQPEGGKQSDENAVAEINVNIRIVE